MRGSPLIEGRWRARHYEQLLQQTWDDESFVFNPASGDTHVLNPVAMQLLEWLDATPADLDGMAEWLDIGNDPVARQVLVQQVEQLVLTGLLCRA